jgi:hypothetical protein
MADLSALVGGPCHLSRRDDAEQERRGADARRQGASPVGDQREQRCRAKGAEQNERDLGGKDEADDRPRSASSRREPASMRPRAYSRNVKEVDAWQSAPLLPSAT